MTMRSSRWNQFRRSVALRSAGRLALAGAVLALGACDLHVNNPSTIGEDDLNDPAIFGAILLGAINDIGYAAISRGYGGTFTIGALLTDEMVTSETRDGPLTMGLGSVRNDIQDAEWWWESTSSGRWEIEDAIRRIGGMVPDSASNPLLAEAAIWAGFANRISGDNFCDAVINGGPLEPYTRFFERAEGFFTSAIEIADRARTTLDDTEAMDTLILAAYGGRAQTRLMLGDWAGAVADAGMVVDGEGGEGDPINDWLWRISTTANRVDNRFYLHSRTQGGTAVGARYIVWGTPFLEWGVDWNDPGTGGDPRVIYEVHTKDDGDVFIGPDGRRPWYSQRKYTDNGADIPLIKGTELRLIEAEARLLEGDIPGMVSKLNEVRTYRNATKPSDGPWNDNPLEMLDAGDIADLDEAWAVLMKERGIELWLEGRRLPDLRRWAVTPGKDKVPFQVVRQPAPTVDYTQDEPVSVYDVSNELCFEVSRDEIVSNPNIPNP